MGIVKYKTSAKEAIYHIFNRGNQKQSIFLHQDDYDFYIQRLRMAKELCGFSVLAYCLMPNHLHLLVQQNDDTLPSRLISSIHTSFARMLQHKYGWTGHVFQGRFKQKVVKDDVYAQALVSYIHLNPYKDGLVKHPKEYPWSSYGELMRDHHQTDICDRKLHILYNLSIDLNGALSNLKRQIANEEQL